MQASFVTEFYVELGFAVVFEEYLEVLGRKGLNDVEQRWTKVDFVVLKEKKWELTV